MLRSFWESDITNFYLDWSTPQRQLINCDVTHKWINISKKSFGYVGKSVDVKGRRSRGIVPRDGSSWGGRGLDLWVTNKIRERDWEFRWKRDTWSIPSDLGVCWSIYSVYVYVLISLYYLNKERILTMDVTHPDTTGKKCSHGVLLSSRRKKVPKM